MKTSTNQNHYICGCCKQELPMEAFYMNKKKQCPENYCKECRKSVSRKHRETAKYIPIVNHKHIYPVITEIKDDEVRKNLILHALKVAEESIERKRRKRWETEENHEQQTTCL